ncbi:glycoside hydrolase family 43 protein [Collybiopsis luxurians FD-317 M1]|uniref:Glycoside hydrolase family 43 protein n=1 Tax=Collybiopsis luxurians FD-317 M1 TaxID=944289 RepID=A0A0D0AZB7_9AGAR|nr:glycoside hydrolase family 43 protein [Collybiopsis luxurians FD-317 M1]
MKLNFLLWAPCLSILHVTFALVNPILPGWNPDPTILRVGSDYFLATSSFEYFPGHPIYHSTNLVDWTLIGHALNRPSQLSLFGTPSDAGAWGLSLRYHNGTFYLASTVRYVYTYELRQFPRSFFVTTRDIFSNDWSDPIYFNALGYDPDLFWDTNGDVYNTWSGNNNPIDKIYGIYQNKIDITTGNSLTPAELIFTGTLPDNSSARPEGPHVYLINSTYYLLIAEGGSGPEHRSTIQRGPSPSGPWANNPANPILFNGANLSLPVQWTGHSDFVEGPDGQWWGVALGVRPQTIGDFNHIQLGRETFLFPVTWENGWPVYNHGQPISTEIPGVLSDKPHVSEFFDDFNDTTTDTLGLSCYFLRTPYKKSYSLTARPGFLRLNGNSFALGDRDNPALVLHKQSSYEDTFETVLDGFSPTSNLTEAGATIFYGDFAHNDIAVTGKADGSGERVIVTRTIVPAQQVGPWALTTSNNTVTTVTYTPLKTKSDPVKLVIVGKPTSYSLGFAEGDDTNVTFTTTFDSMSMSVPPVNDFFFKGAAFGVYNTGNSKPTLIPADFAYWKQTPGT